MVPRRKKHADDPYALGLTRTEVLAFLENLVLSFEEASGLVIDYEADEDLPTDVATSRPARMSRGGKYKVRVGIDGISANGDADERVKDMTVVRLLVNLGHELAHCLQCEDAFGRGRTLERPDVLLSWIAFQHNQVLYDMSHKRNIRENDAEGSGISFARDVMNGTGAIGVEDPIVERLAAADTDALLLEYVNAGWDDGFVYHVGARGQEFESLDDVETAFSLKKVEHMEAESENPYDFRNRWHPELGRNVSYWSEKQNDIGIILRAMEPASPKKAEWHDIMVSMHQSKTRGEFDRKLASVMLHAYPGYARKYNLDGLDLSPQNVFGVEKFPESGVVCRVRLGLAKLVDLADGLIGAIERKFQRGGPDGP